MKRRLSLRYDGKRITMVALPGHSPLDPSTPDSERILRTFGHWEREWDERTIQSDEPQGFAEQVKYAIQCYENGQMPIQVRWSLAEKFGHSCRIRRVCRAAEVAIQGQQEQPAELRRALIAIQRQRAIQGAIQDRAWGPALAGLARAGDVAGELSGEAGLSPEDLRLVVAIEGEELTLPAGQGEPVAAETGETETVETESSETEPA